MPYAYNRNETPTIFLFFKVRNSNNACLEKCLSIFETTHMVLGGTSRSNDKEKFLSKVWLYGAAYSFILFKILQRTTKVNQVLMLSLIKKRKIVESSL